MTPTPSIDRAAASRLVATLEHAWTAIRTGTPMSPRPSSWSLPAATPAAGG